MRRGVREGNHARMSPAFFCRGTGPNQTSWAPIYDFGEFSPKTRTKSRFCTEEPRSANVMNPQSLSRKGWSPVISLFDPPYLVPRSTHYSTSMRPHRALIQSHGHLLRTSSQTWGPSIASLSYKNSSSVPAELLLAMRPLELRGLL